MWSGEDNDETLLFQQQRGYNFTWPINNGVWFSSFLISQVKL